MMEAALQVRLRFVVMDTDRHGNQRVYFRRKGSQKVRLRTEPGTEAFLEEYKLALNGQPKQRPNKRELAGAGSLRWLCERYYQSAEFIQLGESTKRVRRGLLDAICERRSFGTKPFARMEPRHIRELRDEKLIQTIRGEKVETPEASNARVKAMRQLFAWGVEAGLATINPAREVPYLSSGSDGFHTWSVDEVHEFEAAHPVGTMARLAMALLLYTGVRRSDAVRLGPTMEQDDELHFTEVKGATMRRNKRHSGPKHRELPILPQLRAILDATPTGEITYLITEFGKPFTAAGFGNRFRKWCNDAGLPQCSAHGLRKAGATIAANNGAKEHAIMAMYDWKSPKQAALYTRKADRRRLTFENMHLIVPSVPLAKPEKPGGTVEGKKPK